MSGTDLCRLCFKNLHQDEKFHEITEEIREEFTNVTSTKLILATSHSNIICEFCLRSLLLASAVKSQFIGNQQRFCREYEYEDIVQLEPEIKISTGFDLPFNVMDIKQEPEDPVIQNMKIKKKSPKKNQELMFKIQNVKSMQKLECDICNKFYSSQKTLKEHQMLHFRTLSPDFKCDICSKTFLRMKTLRRHKLLHDPSFAKVAVSCPICDRRFQSKPGLYAHMMQHKEPRFNCDLCDKTFFKKFGLQYHMETFHLKERNFHCPHCDKTYIKDSHLTLHIQVEHQNKKYYCGLCRQNFKRKRDCREHILMLHPETKPKLVESLIKSELLGLVVEKINE
ncbi:zinc finger protein 1 homolog [Chironomus tepperi]|uniref:zinc finger protein 1 homolog n=1 Tax=Chironomus tepperi TaxID=113505 RepID=UPI00391F86B6